MEATVYTAKHGQEALDLLIEGGRYGETDLILLDMEMPVLDGLSTTRALRRWEAEQQQGTTSILPRLPIVTVTGHSSGADSAVALEAGVDHCLAKPLQRTTIYQAVMRYARRADEEGGRKR